MLIPLDSIILLLGSQLKVKLKKRQNDLYAVLSTVALLIIAKDKNNTKCPSREN